MTTRNKLEVTCIGAAVLGMALFTSLPAGADEPVSYQADPAVYKLLSENDQFRVILVNRQPGQRDAWHSHASPQVVYALTDCSTRLYQPDGKFTERDAKKGDVNFGAPSASHAAENKGSAVCQQLIVERK